MCAPLTLPSIATTKAPLLGSFLYSHKHDSRTGESISCPQGGWTALDLAKARGHRAIAELLEKGTIHATGHSRLFSYLWC
jgi:ankyrin repeat protein